jgi:hypothetical protein
MALITGSFGQSWITSSQASPAIALTLPQTETYRYASDMGDYASCGISSHYTARAFAIGTSSVSAVKVSPKLLINWYQFTTLSPGIIDTLFYRYREFLEYSLDNINFYYGLAVTNETREGLIVNASSGSPQVSLMPQTESFSSAPIPGDLWFGLNVTSSVFKFADVAGSTVVYNHQVLGAISGATISSSAAEFVRGLGPSGSHLGVNASVVDSWYVSAGTRQIGFRNLAWDGGLHMLNSGTVSVYGVGKSFRVPRGTATVFRNMTIVGGLVQLNGLVLNPGFTPNAGLLRIQTGSLRISGSVGLLGTNVIFRTGISGAIVINGAHVSNFFVTGSPVQPLPQGFNGSWYLYSGSGISGSSTALVSISGSWYTLLSSSDYYPNIDGGRF